MGGEEKSSPPIWDKSEYERSVSVNGHLFVGDQEHSKADSHQSTDGDQYHSAFATRGGKLNALAVFHDGGGNSIGMLYLIAGSSLRIHSIAVGVSDHKEAVVGLTNSNTVVVASLL